MKPFNPNELGIPNGNYFGLPYSKEESSLILIAVPWDVTTSYREGAADGPKAILDASLQVDLFDLTVADSWKRKIGTEPIDYSIRHKSEEMRKYSKRVIDHLESGGELIEVDSLIKKVNLASEELNQRVEREVLAHIDDGKKVGIIGGDHSVPLGAIRALAKRYDNFGILHIDAHADLRVAYEGFTYSHASIMYNALTFIPQISQLTQVAIRDFCEDEAKIINTNPHIRCYTDIELAENRYKGVNWHEQCQSIVATLPSKLYISFDIDGLDPSLAPNTGTPVPGGLTFREADYLLKMVYQSGKEIIGFDLCEVSLGGGEDEWDANVGARLLYKLALYSSKQEK